MHKKISMLVFFLVIIFNQCSSQNNAVPYSGKRFVSLESGIVSEVSATIIYDNYVYKEGLEGRLGKAIPEQSLVLNTSKGLIVMTGCSHPGIADMLENIKASFGKDIYLVFGGFHLMNASDGVMG